MNSSKIKRNRAMLATSDGRRGYTKSFVDPSIHYVTRIHDDGRIDCTCPDARYRHPAQSISSSPRHQCKHARLLCVALRDWWRLQKEESA